MTYYCLVQDDDCHWYVIPADRRPDWELWLSDDTFGYNPPEWAEPVQGWPGRVVFRDFIIES